MRNLGQAVAGFATMKWQVSRETIVTHAAFVFMLALTTYLRFNNLPWNPGWYSDEGSDMDIARHLMEGRLQYFAIGGTPLVAARTPLFHLALIAGFNFWGYDISTARLIAVIATVLTVLLLYLATHEMVGADVALLASFVFAVLPNALIYNRIAFSYNLQAPFFVLCWWAAWKTMATHRARFMVIGALGAGLAYLTALTGLPLVVCVLLVTLYTAPRWLIWVVPLLLLPGLLYLGTLLVLTPDMLAQDLLLTFSRTSNSVLAQFVQLVWNFALWFEWTPWIAVGLAGLFMIKSRGLRWLTLLVYFLTLFNVMRAFGGGDLNYHRYLQVLPFVALGTAHFLLRASRWLAVQLDDDLRKPFSPRFQYLASHLRAGRPLVGVLLFFLLFAPLVWTMVWDYYLVSTVQAPRPTRLDFVLAARPEDAVASTDYVNANTTERDIVLASPTIAWRIHARVADFQQALAFEGYATDNYGAGVSRERFVFDPSFGNATYIIVDNIWRGWASQAMPPLRDYVARIEGWPRVWTQGEFTVYRNPAR